MSDPEATITESLTQEQICDQKLPEFICSDNYQYAFEGFERTGPIKCTYASCVWPKFVESVNNMYLNEIKKIDLEKNPVQILTYESAEQLERLFERNILNTLKTAMYNPRDFVYHENTETYVTKPFHWTVSHQPTVLDPKERIFSIISIKSDKDIPLNEKDLEKPSNFLHSDNNSFAYHVENLMKEMHNLKTIHGVLTTCKYTWFLRYQQTCDWFLISPAIKSDASLIKSFIYFTLSSKFYIGITEDADASREKSVDVTLGDYRLTLSILRA
nr:14061_t:CDS:1 [Entrophospora candida]